MTSPPGLVASSKPFGELITGTGFDLSTRNGQLRYIVHELRVDRRQAQALIRAFEADQRDAARKDAADKRAHAEALAAGAFDDVADHVRQTFRAWLKRGDHMSMRSKPRVSDPRRDGFRQR